MKRDAQAVPGVINLGEKSLNIAFKDFFAGWESIVFFNNVFVEFPCYNFLAGVLGKSVFSYKNMISVQKIKFLTLSLVP